jgi:hypothetical protein
MSIHISFLIEGIGATGSLAAFLDRCTNSCDDKHSRIEGVIALLVNKRKHKKMLS